MDFIEQTKDAITRGAIEPVEGAAEIAFRLNASDPEVMKMGWPLVTSIEQAIEVLAPAEIAFDDVAKRFRYDDIREVSAVLAVETSDVDRRYYPWPGANPIEVHLPQQGLVRGGINWFALGTTHPGLAIQYAKALRLAAHEIVRAGSYFEF